MHIHHFVKESAILGNGIRVNGFTGKTALFQHSHRGRVVLETACLEPYDIIPFKCDRDK